MSFYIQEQVDLQNTVAAAQAAEAKLLEEKRSAGAALLKEVLEENAVMIERKKQEKALEVEEDLRILTYTKAQDAKAQVCLCLLPVGLHAVAKLET